MDSSKTIDNEAYYERAITSALRIGFVTFLILVSYLILKPFLLMVIWGGIIAVGVYPLFEKLTKLIGGRRKTAAIILTLSALAAIIVPSIFMLSSTVDSAKNLATKYEAGELKIQPPPERVATIPVIGKPLNKVWTGASENLEVALKTLEPQIRKYGAKAVNMVAGLGGTLMFSLLSIIIAGVLLLQGEGASRGAHRIFGLLIGKDADKFTDLVVATIKSVVQGVLGIAVIQAIAAGLLMVGFGIPAAGVWALIVLILAIIQLPPTFILLPVAIYSFTMMGTVPAVIFSILALIVSVADTFLKPIFLGRGVDVPMLVILLGAIGGMVAFGILGLFIGSVVLAIAYKVFQMLVIKEVE